MPQKGGRGCLMSPPCLESQGCHLISLCYLLSCSAAKSCYPFCLIIIIFFFFCLLALSSKLFFQKILQYFSLRERLFCMTPVWQLGEVSWSVVCAVWCHMALVFAVMHLYNILYIFFIASVHSPPPKGGRGCLMSPPCLESQGCHLIPLCYLLSSSSSA